MRYSHEADILPVWWFQSACLSVGVTAVSWPSALCLVCYCPVLGWVEWRFFGFVCSTNSRYCFFVSSFLGFSFVWVLHEYLVFLVLRTEPRSGFLFCVFGVFFGTWLPWSEVVSVFPYLGASTWSFPCSSPSFFDLLLCLTVHRLLFPVSIWSCFCMFQKNGIW